MEQIGWRRSPQHHPSDHRDRDRCGAGQASPGVEDGQAEAKIRPARRKTHGEDGRCNRQAQGSVERKMAAHQDKGERDDHAEDAPHGSSLPSAMGGGNEGRKEKSEKEEHADVDLGQQQRHSHCAERKGGPAAAAGKAQMRRQDRDHEHDVLRMDRLVRQCGGENE